MTIRFRSDSSASNIGATANDQSRTCRLGKQRRYGLDKGHPTASANENFFLFPTTTLLCLLLILITIHNIQSDA
ncbi:Cubilin [Trichinella spiralis]|uniref:Cubilin n=2 Tax=Trichinella spiralis TaxID=6334 RepID=A0ABR3KMM5_TRISP|nr:hypothetical protein T01_5867 [Trichinella spiralis]